MYLFRSRNVFFFSFNGKKEDEKQRRGSPAYRRVDFFYDISSPMNKISSDFSTDYLFDRLTLKGT